MNEQRLNEIKERAGRINPNRYDANDTYHSQLDVPELIAEVERVKELADELAGLMNDYYYAGTVSDEMVIEATHTFLKAFYSGGQNENQR